MNKYSVSKVANINSDDILAESEKYDFAIVCLSKESRSLESRRLLEKSSPDCKKIAYLNSIKKLDPSIEEEYIKSNFQICNSVEECLSILYSAIKTLSLCIDVSSIHRRNLASILSFLLRELSARHHIELSIIYTLAEYSTPPSFDMQPNTRVAPVHSEFAGWASLPSMPIAVIVGLGYEKDKALGAFEYIESNERIIYIPNSPEAEYKDQVLQHNDIVIGATEPKNIINYQVDKPALIFMSLRSLMEGIKNEFRPILFPFGPKIFFAVSLIVAIANPEVSVWYVSGEEDETPVDKKTSGKVSTFGLTCLLENSLLAECSLEDR
jgi:hypothetical protein